MMRITELVQGSHTLKAKDIHIGQNKNKMLIVLYSSKTHRQESLPQKIRIEALNDNNDFHKYRFFCPFAVTRNFLSMRGGYKEDTEPLFIFRDGESVQPEHVRTLLREALEKLNLDPLLYGFHSLRAGRTCDLAHKMHVSIEEIKEAGRWRSNAFYKYLKN